MNNDNELLELYEERVNKYIDEKRKTDDLFDYVNRLEERINKAIEYIESRHIKAGVELMPREKELLDILKGEENE